MIERPRKRGPFDPRWMRMRVRRHLHLVAQPTPDVQEDAALEGWEAEGGAPYTRADVLGLRLVGSGRGRDHDEDRAVAETTLDGFGRSLPAQSDDPADEDVVAMVARLPLTPAIPRGHP